MMQNYSFGVHEVLLEHSPAQIHGSRHTILTSSSSFPEQTSKDLQSPKYFLIWPFAEICLLLTKKSGKCSLSKATAAGPLFLDSLHCKCSCGFLAPDWGCSLQWPSNQLDCETLLSMQRFLSAIFCRTPSGELLLSLTCSQAGMQAQEARESSRETSDSVWIHWKAGAGKEDWPSECLSDDTHTNNSLRIRQ